MLLSRYDIVQRCEHDIFAGYCAIGVIIITMMMMMMMIIMMMTMKCLVPLGFLPRTRVCVIVCMCVFVCVCLCVCVCVCVCARVRARILLPGDMLSEQGI